MYHKRLIKPIKDYDSGTTTVFCITIKMFIFQTGQYLYNRCWPITLKQICALETPRKVIATEVISPLIARFLSYENK